MIHTVVFFGASSSQAVHPAGTPPAKIALAVATDLERDVIDFMSAAARPKGVPDEARASLKIARAHRQKGEFTQAGQALKSACLACAHGDKRSDEALRVGFAVLRAADLAKHVGIDAREPLSIFEASFKHIPEGFTAFTQATEALRQTISRADPATLSLYRDVARHLGDDDSAAIFIKEAK